jgi:hypothetical protein
MAGRDDSSKQRGAWNTFFLCESSEKTWKGEIGAVGDRMRARKIPWDAKAADRRGRKLPMELMNVAGRVLR